MELLRHFDESVRSSRSSAGDTACGHGNRKTTTCCDAKARDCQRDTICIYDLYMWSSEDVSERQGVKCRCCLAASYCQLSNLADCGQLNPTELLRCSNLNLAIPNKMTLQSLQKAVTICGHCGQCGLYLATACPSACSSQSLRFDPSTV